MACEVYACLWRCERRTEQRGLVWEERRWLPPALPPSASAAQHAAASRASPPPLPQGDDSRRTAEFIRPHPLQDGNPNQTPDGAREDPWTDPKWAATQWTVYRGVAYDLAPFLEKHPGGNWLINLALKRDCTGLFESYHLRPEVAEAPFKRLPVLADFPVEAIPRAPYPNDSELYSAIRTRVRKELFDGAKNGEHRQGSEWAACFVVGFAAAAYALYAAMPGVLTGAVLGVAGAWIGLTIQHCGNHGAMSTKPWVNNLMGWGMDLIGGSSLMWRYHHQVSHHLHCNDTDMDEDVYSSFPLMRFDARMPKYWFHNFQHIYMWAAFPLMQVAFEVGDMKAFFSKRTAGASLHGADWKEMASVIVGKVVHWGGLLAPLAWGVNGATVAAASLAYVCTQGVVLAALFAVSHNIATTKNPAWLETDELRNDWAVQQIVTSANWGSWIGCFFTGAAAENKLVRVDEDRRGEPSIRKEEAYIAIMEAMSQRHLVRRRSQCKWPQLKGGLNLQIEHHLFPAISFMHYPLISKIAKEEATKRGVPYVEYKWLPVILGDFQKFMKEAGQAPAPPNNAYPARGGMGGDQPSPAAANIAAASSGCPIFQ